MSRSSRGVKTAPNRSSEDGVLDFRRLRSGLTSALVADSMDALGLRPACLGWDIAPLHSGDTLVGRAFIVHQIEVDAPPAKPYQGLLRAIEAIGSDEVFVIPTGRSTRAAVWGELVSTASRHRGAAGALTDGLVRDAAKVRALGFPVFARGTMPLDTNGRLEITGIATDATIDDVHIHRGDLVVGDADGVVIVPWEAAAEVVAQAQSKSQGEAEFRRAVSNGTAPSVAFERYRVL